MIEKGTLSKIQCDKVLLAIKPPYFLQDQFGCLKHFFAYNNSGQHS